MKLPPLLADLLLRRTLHDRFPAYLEFDGSGRLMRAEGCLEHYGLQELTAGGRLPAELGFLAGLLPVEPGGSLLPRLQLAGGTYADLHLFPGDGSDWVLLLDCTEEARSQEKLQQRANELKLLREALAGRDDSLVQSARTGRQTLAILVASLPGAQLASEQALSYSRLVLEPLGDYGGVVLGLARGAVQAAFGPIPIAGAPGDQAVSAAMGMLEAAARWRRTASASRPLVPAPRIGVATGEGWVARATSVPGAALVVTGRAQEQAIELFSGAGPGQIRIDATTAEQAAGLGLRFLPEAPSQAAATDQVRCFTFSAEG